ncbi:phosphotransferase enzyme family protein [Glycomyces tritici]|uniref:Phosphotransferase n=1 Tax=Glycomyces tritici TaxID=2665176 RepID=A0ABT7YTS8_9ACTN|nr:phosphotransferase [Glycomyces tritici]MDN3242039.1 phosphotransferase [Glycomyces tritici]
MSGNPSSPNGELRLNLPVFLARFGLEARGKAEPLTGGEDNVNARVATDRGDVVVREYVRSEPAKVRAELALVAHLAGSGFPTPAPFTADSGERFALVAGKPIAVFPFASGEVPPAMTPDLAEQSGALLARMHTDAAGWTDDRIPVTDRTCLLETAASSDVDLTGADHWRAAVRDFLDRHAEDLALLGEQPAGPLHHDLHRQNLLVEDGRVTAVLDFDELNHGPLILDLARALQYAALEQPDRRLPAAVAEAALAGYRKIRPLTPTELQLLPLAFDLAGMCDAAGFIMWAAPYLGVEHVDECRSWLGYLANRDALH